MGLAAAAATVLNRRRRCSVARTVSHDNNDYHCTAAENTGHHSRGRRCDRCKFPTSWSFCLLIFFFFFRSKSQCTDLDYSVQCVFAREGPVHLPQDLQYINRLSSPIRSLSLLRSTCSQLLTPRFPFSAVPVKVCKPSNPKSDIVFQGPGRVTIR